MAAAVEQFMRRELLDRRAKLHDGLHHSHPSDRFEHLLNEVDSALARLDEGSFGICELCNLPIEADRVLADPMIRVCLSHLSQLQQRALEQDLELAARVQKGLLPPCQIQRNGWHMTYHYEAAGIVGGDYCDVVDAGDQGLYFMVGDVSGKGVAASMLMAHLHAMFRTLIGMGLSLKCILEHAGRVFSESTLPNQYATLVCGRALPSGVIEIANAGHPHPLLCHEQQVWAHDHSGLPFGIFHNEEFQVNEIEFQAGQCMLVYSDGVSEAIDASGQEYGTHRLRKILSNASTFSPSTLLDACRDDVRFFRGVRPATDDVTLFVLSRAA